MMKNKQWNPATHFGLPKEFCLKWGKRWLSSALVGLGAFWLVFFVNLSVHLATDAPRPWLGYVVWLLCSGYLLWNVFDSAMRSKAFYAHARFLEKVEHAEINALRGALDLGESRAREIDGK
jgi:hypothetical protein